MSTSRTTLASLATLALVAALAVPAVATSEPEDEPMLVDIIGGITWQLEQQAVDGEMVDVPDDVTVTLTLDAGMATGSGGCNSYSAAYNLAGDVVSFGPIMSTKMACAGPAGDVENAYLANLAGVASYFSTGGQVVLSNAAGETILVFEPVSDMPLPSDTIEGTTWLLGEQVTDGALAPLPDGVTVTLLMETGQAGGSGGCNSYFASYELDGSTISFDEIGSTLMHCEGPAGEVESAYFSNLALVAGWASDGGRLTLSSADGSALLVFEPAPTVSIVGGWVASGINNGNEAVVTSALTPEVTATFAADGTLSGSDGCNEYNTTYSTDGDAIVISEAIATTLRACPSDELAEQSAQYFAALVASATWSVDASGRLELRDDSGALQVSYEPAAS